MPRGPYRQYLNDISIPIPPRTLRRRRLQDKKRLENAAAEDEGPSTSAKRLNTGVNNDVMMDLISSDSDIYYDSREEDEKDSGSEHSSESEDATQHADDPTTALSCGESSDLELRHQDGDIGTGENLSDTDVSNNDFSSDSSDSSRDSSDSDEENEGIQYEEEDQEPVPEPGKKLYEGCALTKEESELLILSYSMHFGLSDVALEHLIKLIDCHLPSQNHGSLHMFMKNFSLLPSVLTHYYCESCQKLLKFIGNGPIDCECGEQYYLEDLKTKGCYFIQIPLESQLKSLFEIESICSSLRWRDDTQNDVINGRVYKKLQGDGVINEPDLTLQFNTDGVQIFKSSKISLWPIQVCVNELPFRQRRENMILCGLWYGSGKPHMNTFLEPFVDELNKLHTEGFEINFPNDPGPRCIKVHTLIASVDSQARPLLQNIKTFRGAQGCSFCLHEGEEVPVGRGRARMYRGDKSQMRTRDQHLQDSLNVVETGKVKSGIKGASVLQLLQVFNIISSFVPEYMHCVLLGVVKTMAHWWVSGFNKNEKFYIGSPQKMSQVDAMLLAIKPPCELTRTPRSFSDMKLWKASEWKNFLLYYSLPCLQAVGMPKKYIVHWFCLVFSMHTFLQEQMTNDDFLKAETALRKFVLTMEEVYGTPQLMKFNVHLLLHIPKSVRDFGALWGTSAFPYEHYNGVLAKMFRNSQSVPQQICKSYLRLHALKEKASTVFMRSSSACVKSLYDKLAFRKNRSSHCLSYGQSVRLFGAPHCITLSLTQKVAAERLLREEVVNDAVHSFKRFIFNGMLFHIEGYERITRRSNSTVLLTDTKYFTITHALTLRTFTSSRVRCIVLGMRLHPCGFSVCHDQILSISSDSFACVLEETRECLAVFPEMISQKCVVIPYKNKIYGIPLVNSVERD